MKVYCNNCKKEVSLKNNKCPNCGLVFDDDIIEDANQILEESKAKEYGIARTSIVASILQGIGITTIIIGFIVGAIIGLNLGGLDGFIAFFEISGGAFVSGMLFIGFATIIQLLFDIKFKLYVKK